jgi:tetratricopeptide (TPR) repeat protein
MPDDTIAEQPPPAEAGDPGACRDAGDAARDRRDWAAAEQGYRAYLAAEPTDAAIWVQLGHALKEQGLLAEAECAYGQAALLAPGEADTQLQLGHLHKMAGRRPQALAAYAEALRLAPLRAAHDEMVALDDAAMAALLLAAWSARKPADCSYLEITDLFVYLHDHRTVSGIQRVQLGLVAHVLALPAAERERYAFVIRQGEQPDLLLLEEARVAALVQHASGPEVERLTLDRLLEAARRGAGRAVPQPGQCLLVLGAFWVGGSVVPAYSAAKAAGASIGCYIYDLIPATHPEYCDASLVVDFTRALAEGLAFFDFLLAISDYSAGEVRRWMAAQGLPAIPVEAVPLAHDFRLPGQAVQPAPARWPSAIAALRGCDYVLCVCTIEARKNHAYLFQLWRHLMQQGVEMPELVLVGRFGWRVADLYAQFKATGFLGGRIRVLHDLADAELATLYRHCRFTIFPSFVEGWGLPVGESLTNGKVCIASNTSSLPEVGGDLVDYIDPLNLHTGIAAVRRYVEDPGALALREAEIRTRFAPRGWAEVGEAFFAAARRLQAAPPRTAPVPLLRQGELFRIAALADREVTPTQAAQPLRLVLAGGWLAPSARGAAADARNCPALLRFSTDAAPGAPLLLFLRLRAQDAMPGTLLRVAPTLGEPKGVPLGKPRLGLASALSLRLRATADAQGVVEIALTLEAPPGARKPRLAPRLVLQSLAYAAADNLPARLELMETLLLESDG